MRSLNIRRSSIAVTAFAAVAIAGTLAAVDASAAQRFGRDSVYAWDHSAAAGGGAVGTIAGAQRFGRDSVYASPGGATRVTSTLKTQIVRRLGEISMAEREVRPLRFNSRPTAGWGINA